MSSGDYLFEARNVSKRFGRIPVLRNISFGLKRGDFLTLFGANGAGKTTFLRIAATLSSPSDGEVQIAGMPAGNAGNGIRAGIGLIGHDIYLYRNLTARENLRFFADMYGIKDADNWIDRQLETVGLSRRADDPVSEFSRGMKQRLTIARAFLHDPALLLLDEPYTGLDTHASEMLNGLLKSFNSGDRACLMTTHDVERGYGVATYAAILHRGELQYLAKTADMPQQEFVKMYTDITGTQ